MAAWQVYRREMGLANDRLGSMGRMMEQVGTGESGCCWRDGCRQELAACAVVAGAGAAVACVDGLCKAEQAGGDGCWCMWQWSCCMRLGLLLGLFVRAQSSPARQPMLTCHKSAVI